MGAASPRIGLALGSGSARGWSHIGVIRALEDAGIRPSIVCGTSIGAVVGAVYAAGELDRFEEWVRSLTRQAVLGLMDFRLGGGLLHGTKVVDFFRARYEDRGIEALRLPFGCVATELASGREVWLRDGSVIDAVRASAALPGVFPPVLRDGQFLVDGGLVDPVPVSLCRAMGAELVFAVDLNSDLLDRRRMRVQAQAAPSAMEADRSASPEGAVVAADMFGSATNAVSGVLDALRGYWQQRGAVPADQPVSPSMLDVMAASLNIMQIRITDSRLAGAPADAMVRPRVGSIGMMDFHRAADAIEAGRRAAEDALPRLLQALG